MVSRRWIKKKNTDRVKLAVRKKMESQNHIKETNGEEKDYQNKWELK